MSLWLEIAELRKNRYDDLKKRFPYVFKWKWYSYRRFKLKLYVEAGCFLAFWLIKLRVTPNYITVVYALMGLCGGILLSVPSRTTVFIALFFYYFRGIIDWADGIVARVNKQTSISGTVLDSYGAHIGWISLWVGLGIYLGHSASPIFYYLAPIIPALFAADLYSNARDTFIHNNLLQKASNNKSVNVKQSIQDVSTNNPVKNIKTFIDKIFEHNARTVDIIVFMILFELITSCKIVWIFYSAFLFWQTVVFIIRLLMLTRGGWAEEELDKLRKIIYKQD